ncbi:hypothetical protein [Micromonospora sp. NPDC005220]|uniref:hypothetical protein n=1 Tax=Micromonospora sp. NPDC005220 TaxID=3155589 RepID=UPI0033BCE035
MGVVGAQRHQYSMIDLAVWSAPPGASTSRASRAVAGGRDPRSINLTITVT